MVWRMHNFEMSKCSFPKIGVTHFNPWLWFLLLISVCKRGSRSFAISLHPSLMVDCGTKGFVHVPWRNWFSSCQFKIKCFPLYEFSFKIHQWKNEIGCAISWQTEEMCILIVCFLVSLCERHKSWQFWSWKFFWTKNCNPKRSCFCFLQLLLAFLALVYPISTGVSLLSSGWEEKSLDLPWIVLYCRMCVQRKTWTEWTFSYFIN